MPKYPVFLICLFLTCSAHAREIVFAVDASYPPMEMLDVNSNIVGFDPDVVRAIAQEAGFTPVFKPVAWDDIFTGLRDGKYDAIASSVSILEERRETMDFSEPYFEVKQGVVTRKNAGIKSVDDLKSKKVGAQSGTTSFELCKKVDRINGAMSKPYPTLEPAMLDLRNGRIDAVIADSPVAANYALQDPQYAPTLDLAFFVPTAKPEYLGFAVRKGNSEILNLLNLGLSRIKQQGQYDTLYGKWFSSLTSQLNKQSFWSFMKWPRN